MSQILFRHYQKRYQIRPSLRYQIRSTDPTFLCIHDRFPTVQRPWKGQPIRHIGPLRECVGSILLCSNAWLNGRISSAALFESRIYFELQKEHRISMKLYVCPFRSKRVGARRHGGWMVFKWGRTIKRYVNSMVRMKEKKVILNNVMVRGLCIKAS